MHPITSIPLVEITEQHPTTIEPVTLYPTRISLSTWRGCNLKCGYCVLQDDPVSADPFSAQRVASVDALLAAYDSMMRASPDAQQLKLTLNDHTDPFLTPAITQDTLALVAGLAARGVSAPVVITTKLNPGAAVVEQLAALAGNLRLSVFVSVADFSQHHRVELDNVPARFEALRLFASHGLHAVLYVKPVGPWTDVAGLTRYLAAYADCIDEVIMAPVKRDEAAGEYARAAAQFAFGSEAEDAIVAAIHAVKPSIRVSRKRSCAINRRHRLACMPPLFGKQEAESGGDLFANAVSRDGYCELRPAATFAGRADLYLALSCMADLFAQLEVPWALIGSFERALGRDADELASVNDIDVAVRKQDLLRIHQHLVSLGVAPEVYMGCKDTCSLRGAAKTVVPEVISLDAYRYNLRIAVAGVQVDVTTKADGVIAAVAVGMGQPMSRI